ncbi:MAG: TonB-dependent receptor [Bryobacteraceae bacterium]
MFHKRVFSALTLLALLATSMFGQTASSRIQGTIQDQTGAVIPTAKITVVNQKTQGRAEAAADANGNYTFPSLQPGMYNLTAEAPGFRKTVIENIELNVAEILAQNVKLEVGQTTESVEVQANTVSVQTTDSQVARAINMRDIDTLPQLGRSPIILAAFQPGVQVNPGDSTFSHVNGNRQGSNNSKLDGIDVNDSLVPRLGLSLTSNNTDSIGEFRVVTTAGKAEYGRSAGAQVELITRSGSNQFHGGLFEYLRNTALNANDFFNNQSGGKVPKYIQNTYGGSIGGPVIRNKTFFFFNLQRQKTLQETVRNRTVLSAQAKAGIFRWNTSAGVQSYDIVANDPRKLGIDPTVKAQSLDLLPLPNNTDLGDGLNTQGYRFNNPTPSSNQQWTAKGDHNITPNHHVFLRWSYQTNTSYDALNNVDSTFPGQPTGTQGGTRWGYSVGSDWNLSPTTVNEFRAGHQSASVIFFRPRVAGPSIISNDYTDPIATAFPQGRNSPVNEFTDNFTKIKGNHTLKFGANIRHTLQYGYNDAGIYPNITFSRSANGNTPPSTVGPAGLGSTDRTRFENLYNELLGRVDQITTTFNSDLTTFLPAGTTRLRNFTLFEQGYFVQDDWKVRRNLTINVGFRYDIYNAPHERDSLQGTLDKVSQLNYVNQLSDLSVVKTNTYAPTDFNNIAPRFGFAWDVFGNGKTAIRGNYGIYYDRNIGATVSAADGSTPGFVTTGVTRPNNSGTTDVRLRDSIALPSVSGAPVLTLPVSNRSQTVVVFNPNLRSGYVQQYGLSIQREVARNTVFEAGYVGNRGVKLFMQYDLNQSRVYEGFLKDFKELQAFQTGTPVSGTNTLVKIFGTPAAAITGVGGATTVSTGAVGTAAQSVDVNQNAKYAAAGVSQFYLRNYPQYGSLRYGSNDGRSYYDALQLSIRRQTGMLRMSANYTWSHSLDNITVEGNGFTAPIDNFNIGLNKARGDFDKPQSFNAQVTFTPPIGKGKKLGGDMPRWADTLIGGWDIGALFVAQSGSVFTVSSQRATGPYSGAAWANYTGDRNIGGLDKRGDGVYLFSAAEIAGFNQNVAAGFIGDSGRNAFRGPVYSNVDVSLIKKFRITENHAVTFRAEAYNLPNHPAFATPTVNLNTPATFGKFSSTIGGTTRTMQMALRYDF